MASITGWKASFVLWFGNGFFFLYTTRLSSSQHCVFCFVFCYLPDSLVGGKNRCVFVADGLCGTCFSNRAQTFGASLGNFTTQPITHSGVFFLMCFFCNQSGFIRWSESLFMLHYCSSHCAGDSPWLPRPSIIQRQERIDELDQRTIN